MKRLNDPRRLGRGSWIANDYAGRLEGRFPWDFDPYLDGWVLR